MGTMFFMLLISAFLLKLSASSNDGFVFNGFCGGNISVDGLATVTPSCLLMLTNYTVQRTGHAFFSSPLPFRKSPEGKISSFSATYVFAIESEYPRLSGHGIAFVVSQFRGLPGGLASQYLGLFNASNNGNSTNRVLAVELDTIQSTEFKDIDGNHVGIDVNGLVSIESHSAGYYTDGSDGGFKNISLISGDPIQVWVEFDGGGMKLDVTLAPMGVAKPRRPLLSTPMNLSDLLLESMYVGFSSSTGSVLSSHYILGWSFQMNGKARELDLSKLPRVPRVKPKSKFKAWAIWIPLTTAASVLLAVGLVVFTVKRRNRFAEIVEEWELEYGARRFSYKNLYVAAKGFREKDVLGVGGFGRVYRGLLLSSNQEVAIKRVSHESRQGIKEFVAEIVSIGQLRHRNLVQLLGYCRRKGELLLVYDYMPNGSLDKHLFGDGKVSLDWSQRFNVIRGVACGLLYLHEDWEKVVVHRDVKASNILLDADMNARLGDFGLSRLHEHGADPHTTRVVGTVGYLAPELARTGKATTATDVFAFGAFALEVACGRRPIDPQLGWEEGVVLVDWVSEKWRLGELVEARDPRLGSDYAVEEMELVLKLGLLCSHPVPAARPSMRQVVQYLDGSAPLPELSASYLNTSVLEKLKGEGFDSYVVSFPSISAGSLSSGGR